MWRGGAKMIIRNSSLVLAVICCICFCLIATTVRFQLAAAQTTTPDLAHLADRMPLETTKSEALNEFQKVTPRPRKLTDNIYGTREQSVTDPEIGYLFIFCSEKLAAIMLVNQTKEKELADEIFSTMHSKLKQFFESSMGKVNCLTTSACQYEIPYLHYGSRLYKVYKSGVYTIFYVKRAENLVSTPGCKRKFVEEFPKAVASPLLKVHP
jgi:hypothetical protein